jgi:cell division protein FtsA
VERTVASIDIGTSKICTLVGQVGDGGGLQITGVGIVPSRGVRKGVITDIEQAAQAMRESVQRAERVSGYTITRAYVGVGGSHISSLNNRGPVAIGRGDRPVDRDDIDRAMEAGQAIAIPHNRRIIHSISREFTIDDQDGIKNPLGLMGYRLEVEVHIVTGAENSIQNLVRCVGMNGIEVADLVLQPLASAETVLTEDEKKMGVALVDIGGGTTDLCLSVDGSPWQTMVFPVGGNHLTNDIAVGLHTPWATADDIKMRYAQVNQPADTGEVIEIATFGEQSLQTVSRFELCSIATARMEEILDLVARELKRSGFDALIPAGVVLTGGTANLRGLTALAERMLRLPVRIGAPTGLQGLAEAISGPAYASSVGLLLWGRRQGLAETERVARHPSGGVWHQRLREWLKVLLPQ